MPEACRPSLFASLRFLLSQLKLTSALADSVVAPLVHAWTFVDNLKHPTVMTVSLWISCNLLPTLSFVDKKSRTLFAQLIRILHWSESEICRACKDRMVLRIWDCRPDAQLQCLLSA